MTATATESGFYQTNVAEKKVQESEAQNISFAHLVEELRATFDSGKTKNVEWRKQQMRQIKKLFVENHEQITAGILKDHGGPKMRGAISMGIAVRDAELFINNLDRWAAPERVRNNSFLGSSWIRKEPKGVVLLLTPWNFPIAMVFDALVPILAAGNCVLIKPSEISANSCDVIAELIPKYLDNDAVKVVTGGVPEATALLREKYDHIMYTGNGAVGRIVMSAAAKHLTPVTLELGGKSPVYVDKSAKLTMSALRVSQTKWMNAGQICIAPDYILVHEDVAEQFKEELLKVINKHYGKTAEERKANKDFGRIIDHRHVGRISRLLNDTKGKILVGGDASPEDRFVDLTLIDSPDMNELLLKEEIFGPVLPIVTVSGVEEATRKVNQICDKPLALYVFAENQKVIDYFLDNTQSGGVCVNSTMEHLTNVNIPFGGVGESGMGSYHGKFGFDEFTHHRGVLVKDSMFTKGPSFPLPPYKDMLYDLMIKFSVTGFLTDTQRAMLKAGGFAAFAAAGYMAVRSRL